MKYILNDEYISLEDLIVVMSCLDGEVIELVDIDIDNNLMFFEINE